VIKYLNENSVSFFSYQSKELKAFRAVIRNLHPTTDLSFIKNELLNNGFTTRNMMPVTQKLTKTPLPIFFIGLNPAQPMPISSKLYRCATQKSKSNLSTQKEISLNATAVRLMDTLTATAVALPVVLDVV
jgi:hypothetical protein